VPVPGRRERCGKQLECDHELCCGQLLVRLGSLLAVATDLQEGRRRPAVGAGPGDGGKAQPVLVRLGQLKDAVLQVARPAGAARGGRHRAAPGTAQARPAPAWPARSRAQRRARAGALVSPGCSLATTPNDELHSAVRRVLVAGLLGRLELRVVRIDPLLPSRSIPSPGLGSGMLMPCWRMARRHRRACRAASGLGLRRDPPEDRRRRERGLSCPLRDAAPSAGLGERTSMEVASKVGVDLSRSSTRPSSPRTDGSARRRAQTGSARVQRRIRPLGRQRRHRGVQASLNPAGDLNHRYLDRYGLADRQRLLCS
jgi:hypothetical protein